MLHILWMIIKCILIVLGILLGLLLLAVLLLLFCPVCYRASASKKREDALTGTEVRAVVSWLFHGVSVGVQLQEGSPRLRIRVLGIPIDRLPDRKKTKKVHTEPGTKKADKAENGKTEIKKTEPGKTEPEKADSDVDFCKTGEAVQPHTEPSEKTEEPAEQEISKSSPGLLSRIWGTIKSVLLKILAGIKKVLSLPSEIWNKITKTALTIRKIYGKIDWWKQLLAHPRTKAAISLIWGDGKKLLRHILPRKMQGTVIFGSEDPAITGTVLAVLGLSFPFHKNCVAVTPLFEGENVLEGNIRLKGRIYGCVFVKTAIEIYFNKNVKYVISRWKHKEG